jgi:hypothetical protein
MDMKPLLVFPCQLYLLPIPLPQSGVEHNNVLADSPEAGRSAVVARTVRVCAESIRVLSFSCDLLAKITGLARETTCN